MFVYSASWSQTHNPPACVCHNLYKVSFSVNIKTLGPVSCNAPVVPSVTILLATLLGSITASALAPVHRPRSATTASPAAIRDGESAEPTPSQGPLAKHDRKERQREDRVGGHGRLAPTPSRPTHLQNFVQSIHSCKIDLGSSVWIFSSIFTF